MTGPRKTNKRSGREGIKSAVRNDILYALEYESCYVVIQLYVTLMDPWATHILLEVNDKVLGCFDRQLGFQGFLGLLQ